MFLTVELCKENLRSETATHLNWNLCLPVTVDTSKDQWKDRKKSPIIPSVYIIPTFLDLKLQLPNGSNQNCFSDEEKEWAILNLLKTKIYSLIPNVSDNTNICQSISTCQK